jgi:DNA sulfur modification protein DndB
VLRPVQPAHTPTAIACGSKHASLHKLSAEKGEHMLEATSDLVTLKRFPTLEEANRAAGLEAGNTGALSIPVVAFRQGKRTVATGALPMSWVRNRLESRSAKSAKKGGSMHDAEAAWNRPELPEHSQSIAKYIMENYEKAYIIPPLSLNIQHRVHLYIPDYQSDFLPGYLVIPGSATLAVTDGQHRRTGIVQAMDQMDEATSAKFASDAVAIMITCETDLNQIHQDFADCSKTKQLPPSLLAVYDRRNPANRLVTDLERMCPLFKGRIDPTSKTLSKKSTFLFLANQLRQLVKELLAGSYAIADVDFEKRAVEMLGHEEQYNAAVHKFVEYINYLTGFTRDMAAGEDTGAARWISDPSIPAIPVWREIAKLPVGTLEMSQVPVKREEGWICLSATGLNLIGRLGHKLFTNAELATKWRDYADKMGAPQTIDWKRDAAIWQGNIIQGTKLLTQQAPVKNAYDRVLQLIGLGNSVPTLNLAHSVDTKEAVNG